MAKSSKPTKVSPKDNYWGSSLTSFNPKKRNVRDCVFYNMDTKVAIKCQYNPTDLPRSRSVNYASITSPGMAYPLLYFVSGETEEITIELVFYNRESPKRINNFEKFIEKLLPPKHNKKSFKKPPTFKFYYAQLVDTYVLVKKEITEELLKSDGQPYFRRYRLTARRV